jgi:hypothetical protein
MMGEGLERVSIYCSSLVSIFSYSMPILRYSAGQTLLISARRLVYLRIEILPRMWVSVAPCKPEFDKKVKRVKR